MWLLLALARYGVTFYCIRHRNRLIFWRRVDPSYQDYRFPVIDHISTKILCRDDDVRPHAQSPGEHAECESEQEPARPLGLVKLNEHPSV